MTKYFLHISLSCSLLFFYGVADAVEQLEVQGLFSNKAVLMVDGKRHIIASGNSSPEGVKVISVNKQGAILEVDGEQKQYDIGSSQAISTSFSERKSYKETIYKNAGGMYLTFGNINGRSVRFLVDTGASAISMNTDQAKNLGIRYDKYGKPASVSTASGFEKAYRIDLRSVTVGDITERNVEALVIDGKHPGPILLGMTFLGRLEVEHSGNAMTLLQK
ncbi:MAG TPA: TIGR02281 family clan AA aspartic protease [Gammaproteobacteria bacterium]|nr:TIGR02281 family clan AA aspartic protease [Gammaproteobacteria bacterium]